MRDAVRTVVPINDADRRMDVDIQAVLRMYREGAWNRVAN
jgi:hypothetical protein